MSFVKLFLFLCACANARSKTSQVGTNVVTIAGCCVQSHISACCTGELEILVEVQVSSEKPPLNLLINHKSNMDHLGIEPRPP